MSNLTLNKKELKRRFSNRGDYAYSITYELNYNSIIMDISWFNEKFNYSFNCES